MFSIRTLADRLIPKLPISSCAEQAHAFVQRSYRPWRLDAAFRLFLRTYPTYESTYALDALRAAEYARLDRQGHVYLDYTGGSLYAKSQLGDHVALLNSHVFGNPHSKNLASMAMTNLAEQARDYVLRFFNFADVYAYVQFAKAFVDRPVYAL